MMHFNVYFKIRSFFKHITLPLTNFKIYLYIDTSLESGIENSNFDNGEFKLKSLS